MSRILTVDLGNTRCKLRLWDADAVAGEVPSPVDALDVDAPEDEAGDGADEVRRARDWITRHEPARAALCSVASGPRAAAIEALAPFEHPDPGLDVRVREPGRVGRDRLFAARGALEVARRDRADGGIVVVDAGTALTVDALGVKGGAGTFLGGSIAPGPGPLADALARRGAQLFEVDPRPGAHALGRDTREALEGGIVVGFRGAARALVEAVVREAEFVRPALVLTGGARALLLEPEPFLPTGSAAVGSVASLRAVEDLVHLGLLASLA